MRQARIERTDKLVKMTRPRGLRRHRVVVTWWVVWPSGKRQAFTTKRAAEAATHEKADHDEHGNHCIRCTIKTHREVEEATTARGRPMLTF